MTEMMANRGMVEILKILVMQDDVFLTIGRCSFTEYNRMEELSCLILSVFQILSYMCSHCLLFTIPQTELFSFYWHWF